MLPQRTVSFKGANVCIIYEKTKAISLQNITWSELGKKTYKLKSYQSDQKITLLCDVLSEIIDYQARTLLKLCCTKILSSSNSAEGISVYNMVETAFPFTKRNLLILSH